MSDQSINTNSAEKREKKTRKNGVINSVQTLKNNFLNSKDSDSNKKESKSNAEKKQRAIIASIYRLSNKLKDELQFEAYDITQKAIKKAAAMIIKTLLDSVNAGLETFDRKVENSKEAAENIKAERNKILDKKDKFQDMINQLED